MIKANILIVEDELLIAKSIAKKLNKLGYNIANIVASGTEAIEYVSKASLDLILMDIAIKGKIDGIEAAKIIQQTANVPIIFLTAYANDETIERASKTGCYGYLIKPFRDRELQAMIQVTLSRFQQSIPQEELRIKKSKYVVQDNSIYHDKITTLPNKLFLQDLFNYLSSFTKKTDIKYNKAFQFKPQTLNNSSKSIAVFNIQLERLKRTPVGMNIQSFNSLLKEIARRLSNFVNSLPEHGATVYIQQDNFVVLLALDTRLRATQYAQYMLDKLSESFVIDERKIYLMPQIGIAFCPSDSTNIEKLLQQSKKAIEHGKQAKKDTKIYTYASKDEPSLSPDKLRLKSELELALREEELELYYLPEVDLKTSLIVSLEALVQWNHSQIGTIKGDQFAALVEETSLIKPIGEWILQTACRQLQSWHRNGLDYLKIGIFLSPAQFEHLELLDKITSLLSELSLEGKYLTLEVSTQTLINQNSVLLELSEIKKLGVEIALDNLNDDYLSLGCLQQFPFNTLKLNSDLIANVNSDRANSIMVKNVIDKAHQLGLKVTAKQVKTIDELDLLKDARCDVIQGPLFSRPLNAREFQELIISDKYLFYPTDNKQGLVSK